jgi:hypothetical protein
LVEECGCPLESKLWILVQVLLGERKPYSSGIYKQHPSLTKFAHPWRTISPHRDVTMQTYQAQVQYAKMITGENSSCQIEEKIGHRKAQVKW